MTNLLDEDSVGMPWLTVAWKHDFYSNVVKETIILLILAAPVDKKCWNTDCTSHEHHNSVLILFFSSINSLFAGCIVTVAMRD